MKWTVFENLMIYDQLQNKRSINLPTSEIQQQQQQKRS